MYIQKKRRVEVTFNERAIYRPVSGTKSKKLKTTRTERQFKKDTVCKAAVVVTVLFAILAAHLIDNTQTQTGFFIETPSIEPTVQYRVKYGSGVFETYNLPTDSVNDALSMLGIMTDANDIISAEYTENCVDVIVTDIEYCDVSKNLTIPAATVYIESQTIPKGTERIILPGNDGIIEYAVRQKYVDGELTEEKILSQKSVQASSPKVIEIGVGGITTDSEGNDVEYSYYMEVRATAYCLYGITYSGKYTEKGIIAVDKSVIPLGTKVYLTGECGDFGICTCADIGGGIKGNIIDIWMETEEECRQFGIRNMRMYVLE